MKTTITKEYQISKSFGFESAHRLIKPYQGKCNNVHGHSWKGEIILSSNKLDNNGFVLDFSILSDFINSEIMILDHSILLNKSDIDLIDFCSRNNMKFFVFDTNPTSEIISEFIFFNALQYFDQYKDVKVIGVKISETCTSKAYYGS